MQVEQLAELGWHLLPIKPRSKNPGELLGAGWQHKATSDPETIYAWDEGYPGCNWGVLLGPKSGIIDVEYDNDEGKEILNKLFANVNTPCYTSGKSLHRLFKWDARFEGQKASSGYSGTEWRFGNDSAQSVIPPSVHASGAQYRWVISPDDCEVATLPENAWQEYLRNCKAIPRPASKVERVDDFDASPIDRARKYCDQVYNWEELLPQYGWKKARVRDGAIDWTRPGKKEGVSATSNFEGSGTLRVFTSSVVGLEQHSSCDKFAFLCAMEHGDDPMAAAQAYDPGEGDLLAGIDISGILLGKERDDETDDNEFFESMVPDSGLIREVYRYYYRAAFMPNAVYAMSTAIALCQTIFGRKVATETNLRTNDYHLILGPTCSGKEDATQILMSLFIASGSGSQIIPEDVKSASGMLACLEQNPCSIWPCDEFGLMLSKILDKKSKDGHTQAIMDLLLKLYSKSRGVFSGSAYAGGKTHEIDQPHLCVIGVGTSETVFREIDETQVHDGFLGRICFWNVQERPKDNLAQDFTISESVIQRMREWREWMPSREGNLSAVYTKPVVFPMTEEARQRWRMHREKIKERMDEERAIRAAMWGRTAARSMNLALTHRAARLEHGTAEINDFTLPHIELEDIEWGIKISNWVTRLACSLLKETVVDKQGDRLKDNIVRLLEQAKQQGKSVTKTQLKQTFKTRSAGAIASALAEGIQSGRIVEKKVKTSGAPRTEYELA